MRCPPLVIFASVVFALMQVIPGGLLAQDAGVGRIRIIKGTQRGTILLDRRGKRSQPSPQPSPPPSITRRDELVSDLQFREPAILQPATDLLAAPKPDWQAHDWQPPDDSISRGAGDMFAPAERNEITKAVLELTDQQTEAGIPLPSEATSHAVAGSISATNTVTESTFASRNPWLQQSLGPFVGTFLSILLGMFIMLPIALVLMRWSGPRSSIIRVEMANGSDSPVLIAQGGTATVREPDNDPVERPGISPLVLASNQSSGRRGAAVDLGANSLPLHLLQPSLAEQKDLESTRLAALDAEMLKCVFQANLELQSQLPLRTSRTDS
ncbi:MAG: hypothetical protein VB878_08410 [Pirellulaceae bacterium]